MMQACALDQQQQQALACAMPCSRAVICYVRKAHVQYSINLSTREIQVAVLAVGNRVRTSGLPTIENSRTSTRPAAWGQKARDRRKSLIRSRSTLLYV